MFFRSAGLIIKDSDLDSDCQSSITVNIEREQAYD